MNIKEQESQLSLNLNFRIVINVLAFLALGGFIAYRLYRVSKVPKLIETTSSVTVPSLKSDNFESLRRGIKVLSPTSGTSPVRPEPFD